MTRCRNCNTPWGPFSRQAGVGPICRSSTQAELTESGIWRKKADPRVVACNKRRVSLDEKRYGSKLPSADEVLA